MSDFKDDRDEEERITRTEEDEVRENGTNEEENSFREEESENNSFLENEEENTQKLNNIEEVQETPSEKNYVYENPDNISDKKHSNIATGMIAAVIGGLIVALFFVGFLALSKDKLLSNNGSNKNTQNITISPTDKLNTAELVAKKAKSSVVGIVSTEEVETFFDTTEQEGVGSGVVVSEDGYILTNSHVIFDGAAKKIKVLFDTGKELEGKVVWSNSQMDLAVIKVEAKGLKVAELGNSDKINIGQTAIAIGNPLGLDFERTVTQGIISGLDRSLKIDEYNTMDSLIQTDASINSGNSGGPLLNSKGEVIGINTLKIPSGEGLGFAIPINSAKTIIDEIIKNGEYSEAFLGIQGVDVQRYEKSTGTDLGIESGVFITNVTKGSPADEAGIREEDVITKIDGEKVEQISGLKKSLLGRRPGDEIELTIIRDKKEMKKNVKLGEAKE